MTATSGISSFVRPTEIDGLVGLDHIKNTIHYDLEGSLKLGQPYPSYIISGPAGTGKSTLAGIIANKVGGKIHLTIGSDIKTPNAIYDLAVSVVDNDIVFIEEAHTVARSAQAILLEWIENFKILGGDLGGQSVDAPKVIFVLPTTNSNLLSKPLRERCKTLHTSYYKTQQLELILINAAAKFNIDLQSDPLALRLLAQSSRGTPRIAILHRLDLLRKMMAVDNLPYSATLVEKMFNIHGINEWGLEYNDILYCNILYDKLTAGNGRPVSQKILQQSSGIALGVLSDVIEAYLQQISAIQILSGGRILTEFGYKLLGKSVIKTSQEEVPMSQEKMISIDKDTLLQLLESEENLKGGMKILAPQLGLSYPKDNNLLKAVLEELGYKPVQKVGIIKVNTAATTS